MLQHLKEENARLQQENMLLRQQQTTCICNKPVKPEREHESIVPASVETVPTSKSAALSPQQKETAQTLLAMMMTSCSMLFLVTLRLVRVGFNQASCMLMQMWLV